MSEELARWFFYYLEPRERVRLANPLKEVRHIGLMGEELAAFLNTLHALDERQFGAVEKALHMVVPSITGIEVSINNVGDVELRFLEGQTTIPRHVVSEGTLRVLGLLACFRTASFRRSEGTTCIDWLRGTGKRYSSRSS